ncbi:MULTISPECIES: DUF6427 family protein [Flavobacteriaceae]|uniref:DUF6427 family protein n=1 Tax=Lutibacter litoralis TaxID=321268 RepID=A0ABV5JXA1_9FLAO|nr:MULTISPECIES: DUF6427 family protein [Flavobacteriaceae]GGK39661.1 hypothetical protein GCM10007963_04560 [Lutibacter litoralis]
MIANFFNKTKPAIIVNLLLLFTIFYVVATFLFRTIDFSKASLGLSLAIFIGFIFMLLLINFILRKNNLTGDNSYALYIIIVVLGSFYEIIFSINLFFSNLLLLFAFRKIYSLKSGFNTKSKLFDAGFWIGISAILYTWSVLFLVLVYISLFIYNKITLKNLAIPIIGFLFPVIVFFTYHFYFDSVELFYSKLVFNYNVDFSNYNQLKYVLPLSLLITILIWSVIFLTPKILQVSTTFKSALQLIIGHFIISVIIIVFSIQRNGSELLFLVFPSGIIIANFLQKTSSNLLKNLVLYLFLIVSVVVYFL